MALPALADVGQRDLLLPSGIYQATLDEIREKFVETDPTYRQRVEVWSLYMRFRTLIRGLLPVQHEFLDGSFVTSRAAPKDTDVSFWINAADLDALSPEAEAAFEQLQTEALPNFKCDAYWVTPCDPGHVLHDEYLHWKRATEEGWPSYKSRQRLIVPGVTKGYIEVVSQ